MSVDNIKLSSRCTFANASLQISKSCLRLSPDLGRNRCTCDRTRTVYAIVILKSTTAVFLLFKLIVSVFSFSSATRNYY